MISFSPSRATLAAAILTLAAAPIYAQALPANPPTALPSPANQLSPISATSDTASTNRPHRAVVTYAAGLIDVHAENSSLNQILRSISHLTGMTITGGVADERVFGNYGPAEPSTILATLLGGTGSNMLLRESTSNAPSELILTPRTGGVTPPSPTAAVYNDAPDDDQRQSDRTRDSTLPGTANTPQTSSPTNPGTVQPLNNVNGSSTNTSPTASTFPTTNSVPTDSLPQPSTTPSSSGIVDAPNPPPPGTTTSTSPNAVATPEQIYQQLKALQQQQQPAPPPSTTH